jgi:hypothetical protein
MERVSDPAVDWESLWTTLTFEVSWRTGESSLGGNIATLAT